MNDSQPEYTNRSSISEVAMQLIDGYLAGSLPDLDFLRLQRLLIEDPRVADALAMACEMEVFLEEYFREDSATRFQVSELIASVAADEKSREGITVTLPAAAGWRNNYRTFIVLLGVMMLACLVLVISRFDVGQQPAAAAVTELNRILSLNAQSADRTYQISVEDGEELESRDGVRHGPSAQGPISVPMTHGAHLHVRGGRQFVFVRVTAEGDSFVTGSNGDSSWMVRPGAPVQISKDPTRFSRGVPGYSHSVPLINIEDGIEGLLSAYEIHMNVSESDLAHKRTRMLSADRKSPSHLGPRRIEIVYEIHTGLIQQVRFIERPQAHRAPITLLLSLISERNLGVHFYDHQFHHEAERPTELID